MKSSFFCQVSLLLGAIFCGASRAQRCYTDMLEIPSVPDLNMDLMIEGFWYIQDIIVRHAGDVEQRTYKCYIQETSRNEEVEDRYFSTEIWEDASTGAPNGMAFEMSSVEVENKTLWMFHVIGVWLHTGMWVHTDYENYAVQYFCPEQSSYHPESMIIFTRDPTPDPVTLDLLETIAASYGFPKENAVRVNNTDCQIPEINDAKLRGLKLRN